MSIDLTTQLVGVENAEVTQLLRDSFVYRKGVPLQLDNFTKPEYYTSTTATTFLALHHANALDKKLRDEFYETLFWLRDNTENLHSKEKLPEDSPAWDVAESASVWATSLALWAFLGTGYKGSRLSEIKDAIIWLINQQNKNGGWGFDSESTSSLIFTAPVLHVLKIVLASNIFFSEQERNQITRARNFGLQFILNNCCYESKMAFWKLFINGENKPDPTASLYGLWILFEEDAQKYQKIIKSGIKYLRNTMQADGIWELKLSATETQTKYGVHKVIVSFTPSFVILLLRMGISPFDEICYNPICWLLRNKSSSGWNLPGYSKTSVTFTTAYAIWTITNWTKYVIKAGLKDAHDFPYISIGLRKRITFLIWLLIILASIFVLKNTTFLLQLKTLYEKLLTFNADIQLVASIFAIVGISGIFAILKIINKKYANNPISRFLNKLSRSIIKFIYLK